IKKPSFCINKLKPESLHKWEINRNQFELKRVINSFLKFNVKLIKNYQFKENSYHRFLLFEKPAILNENRENP
ncbi:MAG: hypothetical protein ACQESP_12100, partial [Candidatus Muiribacteriota bacterium]